MSRFVSLLFILGAPAHGFSNLGAASKANCGVHSINFIPAEEGLTALNLPLKILAASPKIEFFNANGERTDQCSAAVISDQGHLLTAGHCLDNCIQEQNGFELKEGAHVIEKSKLATIECSVQVNGQKMKAKVVAKNDCLAAEFTSRAKPCVGLDYAILELSEKGKFKDCLNLASKNPGPDKNVLVVGFPARTSRKEFNNSAKDSDGQSEMISEGKTMSFQPTCKTRVELLTTAQTSNVPITNKKDTAAFRQFTNEGTLLQASTDLWKGLSGGALIDDQVTLVGIGQNHTATTLSLECKGSSFFTSAAKIADHVLVSYSDRVQKEVFDCRMHAIR